MRRKLQDLFQGQWGLCDNCPVALSVCVVLGAVAGCTVPEIFSCPDATVCGLRYFLLTSFRKEQEKTTPEKTFGVYC